MIPASLVSIDRRRGASAPLLRRRMAAFVVGSALVAAGCGGSDGEADAAATTVATESVETTEAETTTTTAGETTTVDETTTTTAAAVPAKPLDPPIIEVIDQGTEPYVELRYEIADGVYNSRMSQTQSLSQTIDGQLVSQVEDLETFFEIEITSRAVDGGFEFTSLYTDIGMGEGTDPAIVAASEAELAQLVGSAFVSTIDDQGYVVSQAYVPPAAGADSAALQEMMESIAGQNQFANALPTAPMGVGGSWKQTQELSLNGIDFVQETIFTIASIEGTVLTLTVAGTQTVPTGPVQFPGVPDSVEVSVESWDITSVGDIVADLTQPVPSSSATISGSQIFVGEGSETFRLVQDLGTTMLVTPVG